MASNTVADLETAIITHGYTLTKKYDGVKGICTVTANRVGTGTTIIQANTSRAPLWNAYKRALEFILADITDFNKQWGKTP